MSVPDPSESSDSVPAPQVAGAGRRAMLRSVLWGGGVAGLGGLAGLGLTRLVRGSPSQAKGKESAVLGPEFSYDVTRMQRTDPSLVLYDEERRFACGLQRPRALAAAGGTVYVGGESGIRKFSESGDLQGEIPAPQPVLSIALMADGGWLAGDAGGIRAWDANGVELAYWKLPGEKFLPTAITVAGGAIFVADAGARVVRKLDLKGAQMLEIGARDTDHGIRGFVIPSPYFCVRMAPDGLLRVTNPGEHLIEAFTTDGDREVAWGRGSFEAKGFCGCCNPVDFQIFPDGSFVTCEKGLPRVKIYNEHGEFTGFVAGPEAFPEYLKLANTGSLETHHAGIFAALGSDGRVWILDGVGGTVRAMKPKPKEAAAP